MSGRKEKNTVDYFPHMATSGKTMFVLEANFGNEGYAIWFKTLEMLAMTENHFLDLREENEMLFVISKMKTNVETLTAIYDLLSKLEAIDREFWEQKIVFSENFIDNIARVYDRRNKECLRKPDLWLSLFAEKRNSVDINGKNDDRNTESKVKYSKVKESKGNKSLAPSYNDVLEKAKEIIPNITEAQKKELQTRYNSWAANDWKDREGHDIRSYWKQKVTRICPYLGDNGQTDKEKVKIRKQLK